MLLKQIYMNTKIAVGFHYGAQSLIFTKTLALPFTPFYNMGIIIDRENDYVVKLTNDSYCSTEIEYDLVKERFEILVRNRWKQPVTDDTIDSTLEMFKDWDRKDSTDITVLKEIMKRDYERSKK